MRSTIAALTVVIATVAPVAATAAPATTTTKAAPNVVQVAVAAGSFKTLVALVKEAGLAGTLSTKTVTVFAPTDAAFAKVPKATLAKLKASPALLKKVLLYHVVAGRLPAAKVVARTSVRTLEGQSLPVKASGKAVHVGPALVVKPDVAASNGVIHVIDRVLVPSM